MRVGIIGGTFDPIHLGHLNAAQEISEEYGLDEIIVIPSYSPPHKKRDLASSKDRLTMCRLATESNPLFKVSDIEIVRRGISYTIDTIKELKSTGKHKCEIYFIIGSDAFADIWTWKDTKELFHECNFVVDIRGNDSAKDIKNCLEKKSSNISPILLIKEIKRNKVIQINNSPFNVYITKTTLLDISSTLVREKIAERKQINYLLAQKVEDYIAKEGLYGYNR